MRAFAGTAVVIAFALAGLAGASCSSVSETGTQRGFPGAGGPGDASASGDALDGAPRSVPPSTATDAAVHPRRMDQREAGAGRGATPEAATPRRDARADGSDVVVVDGASTRADAATAGRDAASDARDAGPSSPDCACPGLDGFFLDATTGPVVAHLIAPYVLGIYCTETTVQLGHPQCGGVYRLSACKGPDNTPPCFYMAVDRPGRFLLGNFVDVNGTPWDILGGDIFPDPPSGRVETGTFSATMRPRAGGDAVELVGNFRACVTRMPACSE